MEDFNHYLTGFSLDDDQKMYLYDIVRANDYDDQHIYEILGLLSTNGYEDTVFFLENEVSKADDIIWKQSSMNEGRIRRKREIAILEEKETGIKGIGKCKSCGSEELTFQLLQTSGGDESTTVVFKCTKCKISWKTR